MKGLSLVVKGLVRLAYFALAVALIGGVILLNGQKMLGHEVVGSDNIGFITYAKWIYDWFPKVPFWYPQQGAGVSYVSYYPILSHLMLTLVAKISGLGLVMAFKVLAFGSALITCLGIYFLGVRLTKSQTVGLLASVFYPLSGTAWIWIIQWGFTAEHLSYMFMAPSLIWLDLYWSRVERDRRKRFWLLLFLISVALLLLTHPFSFTSLMFLIGIWWLIRPLIDKKGLKGGGDYKQRVMEGIKIGVLAIMLTGFWLVPFFSYSKIVAFKFDKTKEKQRMLQNAVNWRNVFQLTNETALYASFDQPAEAKSNYNWRDSTFPLGISLLALIGLIGSFWLNKNLFALGLANLVPLSIALLPRLAFVLSQVPGLRFVVQWRVAMISSKVVIPILAGFGAYSVAYLVSFPLKWIAEKMRTKLIKVSFKALFSLIVVLLSLGVAVGVLYKFKNWPNNPDHLLSFGLSYDTDGKEMRGGIDLRNIWLLEADYCKVLGVSPLGAQEFLCRKGRLAGNFWPHKLIGACIKIEADDKPGICEVEPTDEAIEEAIEACKKEVVAEEFKDICATQPMSLLEQLDRDYWSRLGIFKERAKDLWPTGVNILEAVPAGNKTRLDINGSGGLLMVSQYYLNRPQLPVYHNLSSLVSGIWNYQMTAFYDPETLWSQPEIVEELAKYFSLEYVILAEKYAPMERYRDEFWEKIYGEDPGLSLWRFKQPKELLTVSTKPLVLVIGQEKTDGYFRIFHLANLGTISFDEAILVKGGEFVDEYKASELEKFKVVILEGYQYKKEENKAKAWQELEKYVRGGGSLLISTGWQFTDADWELEETPEFFPTSELKWLNVGKSRSYVLEDEEIGGVDVNQFSPLDFHGAAWGISSTEKDKLRDWAKVILSAEDKLLVAGGRLGEGRVIWTGLDLVGHIGAYEDNPEEVKFFGKLIDYLLAGKTGRDIEAEFSRDYPDKLEIVVNQSTDEQVGVYWSEAVHPDFKAKLIEPGKKIGKRMPVYKAGPGMSLFILPKVEAGSRIIWEYKKPLKVKLGWLVSGGTLIGLLIYVFKPEMLIKKKDRLVRRFKKVWLKTVKTTIKTVVGDEDE